MRFGKIKHSAINIVIAISIWQIISMLISSPIMPDVKAIFVSMKNTLRDKDFISHYLSSLQITVAGIGIACTAGILLAILCLHYKTVKIYSEKNIHIAKNIPAIALFPMFLLMFGAGNISRIIIIFWTAFPPIFTNTLYGLENVDANVIEAASLSANRIQSLWYIKLPMALGNILMGVKISIGTGFISLVTAEMLGASKGIGYLILFVDRDLLKPNDYNPNKVTEDNLALLMQSILTNGWTLPIVCRPDYTIIDGFHRWTVAGREPLLSRLEGKVPIVIVDHKDHDEDIYGTITHNRARGQHLLEPMKKIVKELIENGKTIPEISKQLGMKPEEIFRLSDFTREDFLKMLTEGHVVFSKAYVVKKI